MKKFLFFVVFALLLAGTALAVDTQTAAEAVPDAAREILGELDWNTGQGAAEALARVWDWVRENLESLLRPALRSAATALGITLLCSLAGALAPEGKTPDYVTLGGALAVATGCAGNISGYLSQAREALYGMVDFSRALLPCVAAASAASGHAVSGAARYAASSLFMDVLLQVGTNLVLPLVYAYLAAAVARAALPTGPLGGPVSIIKWVCTTAMTGLCTVFTLYLSISGAVSSRTDALAGAVVKTVVSTALPVVGKIVSDAAGSYLAGAELLRGAVGAAGLLVVLAVCIGPVLSLGLHYLCFKAAACLAEPFAPGRLAGLLGDIGTACGMALGLVGSGGAMLFISIVLSTEALGL